MMLGWPEITLILLIVLLIFGPSRLPQLAKSAGETMREFRKASAGTIEAVQKSVKPTETSILDLAQTLGINIDGKTPVQAADEIIKKLKK